MKHAFTLLFTLLIAVGLAQTKRTSEKTLRGVVLYDQPTSKVGIEYSDRLGVIEFSMMALTDVNQTFGQVRVGIRVLKAPFRVVVTPFYLDLCFQQRAYRTPFEVKVAKQLGGVDLGLAYTWAFAEPDGGYFGANARYTLLAKKKEKKPPLWWAIQKEQKPGKKWN